MATLMTPLAQRSAWKALEAHRDKVRGLHLRKLFEDDPTRGQRLTVEALGLYFDCSKNRITDETLKLLLQLATKSGLRARIDALFAGEKQRIASELESKTEPELSHDSSTNNLIRRYRKSVGSLS